jgi:hypothetical protein
MTTELEALQQAMARYADEQLERLFQANKAPVSTIRKDGAEFTDGKRRVRSKPKCNLAASAAPWRNVTVLRKQDDSLFYDMAAHAVGYPHSTSRALAQILSRRLDARLPAGLRDTTTEAARNRTTIARYNLEFPEKDNPEHKLFPRDARNGSPTRKKDAGQLNAFWDYRELNKSVEPLQSNWIQADNDNYNDPGREEGDPQTLERDVEAELETRPNENESIARFTAPTVAHETRQAGLITGPRLSDCGYCMATTSPLMREMKIPVGGDVECMVTYTAVMKKGNRTVTTERHKLVMIDDLKKTDSWSIYRIGDLRFAPDKTKNHYRGQVTHYRDDGRWFPAKDQYGTPYGPKSTGSNLDNFEPLYPRKRKGDVTFLSPAARAKQRANKDKPIPCPMMTDEMLEAFRRKQQANGKPANDNEHHDGLPYDVDSADELQFGYTFGKKYTAPDDSEPFDDLLERRQTLAVVKARLSPQARLVANIVVQTDETDTVAQNYADVGAVLATGRKNVSGRTLIRHGQNAVSDAAKEIGSLLQDFAA